MDVLKEGLRKAGCVTHKLNGNYVNIVPVEGYSLILIPF